MTEDDFNLLMSRLKEGDEGAASEVFGRYVRRLIALSSRQFDSWLRQKADPEGVVQSAYKSFFVRHREGQYDVPDWESLWGLLVVITLRKCHRRYSYLSADKRDVGREASVGRAADDDRNRWEYVDPEPTPDEAAVLSETIEELLSGLEGPERSIVELSLQGHSTQEIVDRLGCSQRTVQRVRERTKKHLSRPPTEPAG